MLPSLKRLIASLYVDERLANKIKEGKCNGSPFESEVALLRPLQPLSQRLSQFDMYLSGYSFLISGDAMDLGCLRIFDLKEGLIWPKREQRLMIADASYEIGG